MTNFTYNLFMNKFVSHSLGFYYGCGLVMNKKLWYFQKIQN